MHLAQDFVQQHVMVDVSLAVELLAQHLVQAAVKMGAKIRQKEQKRQVLAPQILLVETVVVDKILQIFQVQLLVLHVEEVVMQIVMEMLANLLVEQTAKEDLPQDVEVHVRNHVIVHVGKHVVRLAEEAVIQDVMLGAIQIVPDDVREVVTQLVKMAALDAEIAVQDAQAAAQVVVKVVVIVRAPMDAIQHALLAQEHAQETAVLRVAEAVKIYAEHLVPHNVKIIVLHHVEIIAQE